MHHNESVVAALTVFRQSGEELATVVARESWDCTDADEALIVTRRLRAWLETIPAGGLPLATFPERHEPTWDDLERILDRMLEPERLHSRRSADDVLRAHGHPLYV